jgi:flagellar assembly factor FliW
MPELESKYFGKVGYDPDSEVEFPLGLPGFEQERRFVLIEQTFNRPIVFLQSLSRPELCFVTLPVQTIVPGYRLQLGQEDLAVLGVEECWRPEDESALLRLAIVSLAENEPPTANLLSPIIVHCRNRLAVQVIQSDSPYSHRHPLYDEAAEAPCL